MENFESRVKEPPYTLYHNDLIQEETVFKNASQKLCYIYLYSYAKAKKIFPSMSSIAVAICSSDRNAMRVIEQLEEMGFIEVKREQGKNNLYILNDYYEVAEKLTHDKMSLVQSTRDKMSPVTNCHPTRDKMSPLPVTNCHPITKTKTKKKNKNFSLDSLGDLSFIDLELKNKYPEKDFDGIRAKMIKEAEKGEVSLPQASNYKGLLESRLEKARKRSERGQRGTKRPTRTEILPEWFNEQEEPLEKLSEETTAEYHKRIEEKLMQFRKKK